MKNISEAENNYLKKQYSINPKRNKQSQETSSRDQKSGQIQQAQKGEGEVDKEEKQVLSTDESTTLHMLFGSSKPEEMQFYTKNKIDQISKGHLLDLEG